MNRRISLPKDFIGSDSDKGEYSVVRLSDDYLSDEPEPQHTIRPPPVRKCWHTAPSSAETKYSFLQDNQRPHSTGSSVCASRFRLKSQSRAEKLEGLKLPPESETKVSNLFTKFKKALHMSPYDPLPRIGADVNQENDNKEESQDCSSSNVEEGSADYSAPAGRLIRSDTYTILNTIGSDEED